MVKQLARFVGTVPESRLTNNFLCPITAVATLAVNERDIKKKQKSIHILYECVNIKPIVKTLPFRIWKPSLQYAVKRADRGQKRLAS